MSVASDFMHVFRVVFGPTVNRFPIVLNVGFVVVLFALLMFNQSCIGGA